MWLRIVKFESRRALWAKVVKLQAAGLQGCLLACLQPAVAAAITTLAWLIEFHFASNLHDPYTPTLLITQAATGSRQRATCNTHKVQHLPRPTVACVPHIWRVTWLAATGNLCIFSEQKEREIRVCHDASATTLASHAICLRCLPHENSAK